MQRPKIRYVKASAGPGLQAGSLQGRGESETSIVWYLPDLDKTSDRPLAGCFPWRPVERMCS